MTLQYELKWDATEEPDPNVVAALQAELRAVSDAKLEFLKQKLKEVESALKELEKPEKTLTPITPRPIEGPPGLSDTKEFPR